MSADDDDRQRQDQEGVDQPDDDPSVESLSHRLSPK
jgi:hypothetical protein